MIELVLFTGLLYISTKVVTMKECNKSENLKRKLAKITVQKQKQQERYERRIQELTRIVNVRNKLKKGIK